MYTHHEENLPIKSGAPSHWLWAWKLTVLPQSIKLQTDQTSSWLFFFFFVQTLPPWETPSAANGAQQRLPSVVSDTHVWCDLWLTSTNPQQILLSLPLHSHDPPLYQQRRAFLKTYLSQHKSTTMSQENGIDAEVNYTKKSYVFEVPHEIKFIHEDDAPTDPPCVLVKICIVVTLEHIPFTAHVQGISEGLTGQGK